MVNEINKIKDKYKISIVAPASTTANPKDLEMTSKAIGASYPEDMLNFKTPLYLSNSDEYRFKHFASEISKPDKQVIWTLRGGSGSAHIIDALKEMTQPKTEHYFIGYSDITALHLFLSQEWGWKTIHGGVIDELYVDKSVNPDNYKFINDIIMGKINEISFDDLIPLNEAAKNILEVSGPLTGGNVGLLQNSLGTNWELQSDGKIIFFESVYLIPYLYDRILFHLYQAKKFNNVKAVVIGNVKPAQEDSMQQGQMDYITKHYANLLDKQGIPVFKSCMFGHGYNNYPLVYNSDVHIYWQSDRIVMKQKF